MIPKTKLHQSLPDRLESGVTENTLGRDDGFRLLGDVTRHDERVVNAELLHQVRVLGEFRFANRGDRNGPIRG